MKIVFVISIILLALTAVHDPYKIQFIHDQGTLIFVTLLVSGLYLLINYEEPVRER